MKTKLLTIAAIAALLVPCIGQTIEDLTTAPQAQLDAQDTVQGIKRNLDRLTVWLQGEYAKATRPGGEQAYLDALGDKAFFVVSLYREWRNEILAIYPNAGIPEAPESVWVHDGDGTMTYVAPVEP